MQKQPPPPLHQRPPSLRLSPRISSHHQDGKRSSARSGRSSVHTTAASRRSTSRSLPAKAAAGNSKQSSSSSHEEARQDGGDAVSAAATVKKRRKKKWSDEVRVDLSCCKYEVLRIVLQKLGWQEAGDDNGWHVFWTDTSIGPERLMTLQRGQKVIHFLGMLQICRKKSLARHLSNMRRMFPADYKFFPRAFILPNHIQELVMRLNSDKIQTYILKPDNGCQGRGVVLVQNVADLKQAIGGMAGSNMLAQKYLTNPMLLNGYKFDLRIYVLILSCDPLRLFLYREGLVRFCTEKYMKPEKANLKLSCMHLTNYSVNKNNTNFEFNSSVTETDKGSKWTLTSLYKALAAKGYDVGRLKRQIRKMVVMTIISIVPLLVHNYRNCLNEDDNGRSCFELLGMDVLLDDKCRPWLLEVNHSPSFSIDTPLDFKVKESLLCDTLRLLNVDPCGVSRYKLQDKKGSKLRLYGCNDNSKHDPPLNDSKENNKISEYDDFERKNLGNFDRLYPPDDANLQKSYMFLSGSEEIFKQSFDMKIKDAILKAQEIRKKEEMEKEAAEKKKLKKLQDMRKKAQETAKLAALAQQQQQNLLGNSIMGSDSEYALDGIERNMAFDMVSAHSSMETPTGWDGAQNTSDKVSERDTVSQHASDKSSDVFGQRRILDVQKTVQQETLAEAIVSQFVPDASSPGGLESAAVTSEVFHQPNRYDHCPTNANSKICSSFLPCIVPRSLHRHHNQRSYYAQGSHHSKRQDLGENMTVQQHVIARRPHVVARDQLVESDARDQLLENDAPFLCTRSYHGKFQGFRKSPFPLRTVGSNGLCAGRGNFTTYESYVPTFQPHSVSTNIKCSVNNRHSQGLRGLTRRNM